MRKKLKTNFKSLALEILTFKLTSPGAAFTAAICIAAGLLAIAPAYKMVASLFFMYIFIYLVGALFKPRIVMTGRLPDQIVANRELVIQYKLTNMKRRAVYDLALGFFSLPKAIKQLDEIRIIERLGPGENQTYDLRIKPLRRGLYDIIGPRYFTTFPLNLFRNGPLSRQRGSILVIPNYHTIGHVDIPADSRYQPGGVTSATSVGESPEYIGNREFRTGDSPRQIDPRAWARLAVPAVKEYNDEYYCHVAIIMDTYIARGRRVKPEGFAELEAAVSMTASLVDSISRSEDIIDVFAAGPDLYVFRAGRNTAQFDNLLEILACIEHCNRDPFEKITPALTAELHSTSAAIFLLLDWDDSRENLVRMTVEAGCSVRVIIITDKKTTKDFHNAETWAGDIVVLTPEMVSQGAIDRL